LHHHIVAKYVDANIDLLYGYDVEPVNFGNDDDEVEDFVTVRISKSTYAASQDSEQLCSVDGFSIATTIKLLIGADGSARTVANAMERFDAERISKLNPIQSLFAEKPFKVTRFEDDNPRVCNLFPFVFRPRTGLMISTTRHDRVIAVSRWKHYLQMTKAACALCYL
jgi:hypothetical protein